MMNHSFRKIFASAIAIIAAGALIVSCGGSSSGGSTAGEGDSATLSATDFPNNGVCINGSKVVTSQELIDMLGSATQVEVLLKPYTSDADIPFICGLNAVWDPSDANAFARSTIFATTIPVSDILGVQLGAIYMCNTGFGFTPGSAATAGLHEAETYRGELILTDAQANQIRIRIRFTVSGPDAGATLASLGLSAVDFALTDATGTLLNTAADVLALFAANPGSVTVNLVSGGGATTHITALGRIICWEQI
jgi:hypothetical protein